MIPDPLEKTTKIPIKVVNGQLEYFYGGPLPGIEDGTIGELVVPSFSVSDPKTLQRLHRSIGVQLLPAGSNLLIAVNRYKIPGNLNSKVRSHVNTRPVVNSVFVKVELKEPLRLLLRGSKSAILVPTGCHIPDLECDASSVNHAYGIISLAFEPSRRSHGGNVFHKAFFKRNACWFELERLRAAAEAEFEHLLKEN